MDIVCHGWTTHIISANYYPGQCGMVEHKSRGNGCNGKIESKAIERQRSRFKFSSSSKGEFSRTIEIVYEIWKETRNVFYGDFENKSTNS